MELSSYKVNSLRRLFMRLLNQINLHAFQNATDLTQSIYEEQFEIKGSMKHRQNIW